MGERQPHHTRICRPSTAPVRIEPFKSNCQPKAGGDIKEGENKVDDTQPKGRNIPVMEYEPADKAEIWLVNSRLSSIELEELCAEFDED